MPACKITKWWCNEMLLLKWFVKELVEIVTVAKRCETMQAVEGGNEKGDILAPNATKKMQIWLNLLNGYRFVWFSIRTISTFNFWLATLLFNIFMVFPAYVSRLQKMHSVRLRARLQFFFLACRVSKSEQHTHRPLRIYNSFHIEMK